MIRNLRSWSIWCGVGTIGEKHEEITGLTKAEALSMAEEAAKCWPRVLICQKSARYSHGVELGGYEPWGKWGIASEGKSLI